MSYNFKLRKLVIAAYLRRQKPEFSCRVIPSVYVYTASEDLFYDML